MTFHATEQQAETASVTLRRMLMAADASNQAGENAVVHAVMGLGIPVELIEALLAFDLAMRDHLHDCWRKDRHTSGEDAIARYSIMRDARSNVDLAINKWVERHAKTAHAAINKAEAR